ncbi:O-antigen ligase family protein [Nocardioides gansuensis]|uniref:O-antigen ligase family protein n=1 Tax=Nocardioides gansuensis TaxID=2138300 RepID=UPI000E3063E8|nr:hypothetical protein [Nocardioides gansuensis]
MDGRRVPAAAVAPVVGAFGLLCAVQLPSHRLIVPIIVGVFFLLAVAAGASERMGVTAAWPVAVVAFLQPLNGIRPFHPSVSVGDVALVVLALLCLPFLGRFRMPPHVLAPFVGVMVLAAGGLLGTIATDTWDQWTLLARFVLGMPVVMLVLCTLNPSPRVASLLGVAYAAGATLSAASALAGRSDPYFQRAFGFGEHLMHLALTSLFGTVVAIGWCVSARSRWTQAAAALMGVVCLAGQVLSGARSAMLGTFVAVAYLALLGRWRGIRIAAAGGVVGLVALAAAFPFLPPGSTVHRALGIGLPGHVAASNSDHLSDAAEAIAEIGSRPWTGLGFHEGLDAHNLFLEAANVGGVLGLVGLLLIWGSIGLLLARQLRHGVRREHWLRASLLVAVLGYFVIGQLEPIIWDRHLWFFITVALFALPPTLADGGAARQPSQPTGSRVDSASAPSASSAWTSATSQ